MYSNEIVVYGKDGKKSVFKGVKNILFTFDKLLIWGNERVEGLDTKGKMFFIKCDGVIEKITPPDKKGNNLEDIPKDIEINNMEIYGVLPELIFDSCSIPVNLSLDSKKKPFNKTINNNLKDSDLFLSSIKSVLEDYSFIYSKDCSNFEEAGSHILNMIDCVNRARETFCACSFMPILLGISDNLDKLFYKSKIHPYKKVGSAWVSGMKLKYLVSKLVNNSQYIKLSSVGV